MYAQVSRNIITEKDNSWYNSLIFSQTSTLSGGA